MDGCIDIQKVLDSAEQRYLENTIKNAVITLPGGELFLKEGKCNNFLELQQKASRFLDVNLKIRNSSNVSKITNAILTVAAKLVHDNVLLKNCKNFGISDMQMEKNFKALMNKIENTSEEQINLIRLRSCLSVAKERFYEEKTDSIPSVLSIVNQTWSSAIADYISHLILPVVFKDVTPTDVPPKTDSPTKCILQLPDKRKRPSDEESLVTSKIAKVI